MIDVEDIPSRHNRLERLFAVLGLRTQGKWIIYGIIVGMFAGLGAWVFFYTLAWLRFLLQGHIAGAQLIEPRGEDIINLPITTPFNPWIFFLLPAVGGLLSGLLVYTFAPEAEGHGTDAMIDAYHNRGGKIRARVPLLKSLATLCTMATGGSAGREGPIAQIGGGIGYWLARVLGLNVQERRTMLLMGAGGGLGAIFRSPMGGAVTAIEVLYSEDLETSAMLPTIISSVTAYAIFSSVFGYHSIFVVPAFRFQNPRELVSYAALAIIMVPLGVFYTKFFYSIRDAFRAWKIPRFMKPMIGGLLVGCTGLAFPQVYSGGYGVLQQAILGELSPVLNDALLLMLALLFYKILATTFTIGSGGSGGIFGPTLFIGGMLGGVVGIAGHHLWPEVVTQPGAYVVVGMAGFFAGVAKAPLGAILMTMEMTGGYGLLAPLLLVSVFAMIFTRPWSIYENQVENRLQSPAHLGDYTVNILRELTVEDVFQPADDTVIFINEDMPFSEVKRLIARTSLDTFPVLDTEGRFKGVVSLKTARSAIFEDFLDELVLVRDIQQPATPINVKESLYEALIKFVEADYSQLPVVDPENPDKILGFFTHEDLMKTYRNEMIRRKGAERAMERAPEIHAEQERLMDRKGIGLPGAYKDSVQVEIEIRPEHTDVSFKKIRDVQLPEHCLIAAIRRGKSIIVPRGDTVIEPGDTLVFLTTHSQQYPLREWVSVLEKQGKVKARFIS